MRKELRTMLLDRADMYIEEDDELIKQMTCDHDLEILVLDEWHNPEYSMSYEVWYCPKCGCDDEDLLGIHDETDEYDRFID